MTITYSSSKDIPLDDLITFYKKSFTETPRPTQDKKRMALMLENATFIISAWDTSTLVGICRCLSDYSYVTYISDLAVHENYQHQGIGKMLIQHVKQKSSPDCKLVLLSNTNANTYYPHIGFSPHDRAWTQT
ncbi:GNAT family N-acetyltransferase [Candidatus Marinamargulisbacteria bacterium SCGC AG-343-D04]|nr:GNAT family N-acetyltransferase [Candidatus Marinamargulisbacteria bacterium SCGC AG-343-D04]